MNHWIRKLTESQWIMLMTVAVIGIFMMMASSAQAFYAGWDRSATTLTHCGFLPTKNTIYTDRALNTRIIQTKLENLGYTVGPRGIDGVYGKDTRSAVTNFQRQYNLKKVDGVVGHETAMLLAYNTHPSDNVRRCHKPARPTH